MIELERYKKALEKISKYGIKPTGETEIQRIKRLKSIADKALFIVNVVVPKGTLKTFEDLPEETKEYRKSGDAIVWKNK